MRSEPGRITYGLETWIKGTRGITGPHATDQARMVNLRLYPNGTIGPRPRWKRYGNTATVGATTYGNAETNTIVPAIYRASYGAALDYGWLVVRTGDVRLDYQSGLNHLTHLGTSLGDTNGPHSWISRIGDFEYLINELYITINGSGLVAVDAGAAVDTTFSGAATFNFEGSCIHQGRSFFWGAMVNAGVPAEENRVYYSDPYDYAVFTSGTQFFEVDGNVSGAASVGSTLLIWTDDGTWFAMQGRGDPADATFYTLGKGRLPHRDRQPQRYDDKLIFMASDSTTVCLVGEDGIVDDTSLSQLSFVTEVVDYHQSTALSPPPISSNSVNNTVTVGDTRIREAGWNMHRGVWTEEDWSGVNFGGETYTLRADEVQGLETLQLYNGASAWETYERKTYIAAPEIEDDVNDPFAENPTARLDLPRLWFPDRQVRVKRLIVDVQYWKSANYETLAMTVEFTQGDNPQTTVAGTVGPDNNMLANMPDGAARPERLVVYPNNPLQMSKFVDISLNTMRGFAIEKVTVDYETSSQELFQ